MSENTSRQVPTTDLNYDGKGPFAIAWAYVPSGKIIVKGSTEQIEKYLSSFVLHHVWLNIYKGKGVITRRVKMCGDGSHNYYIIKRRGGFEILKNGDRVWSGPSLPERWFELCSTKPNVDTSRTAENLTTIA